MSDGSVGIHAIYLTLASVLNEAGQREVAERFDSDPNPHFGMYDNRIFHGTWMDDTGMVWQVTLSEHENTHVLSLILERGIVPETHANKVVDAIYPTLSVDGGERAGVRFGYTYRIRKRMF